MYHHTAGSNRQAEIARVSRTATCGHRAAGIRRAARGHGVVASCRGTMIAMAMGCGTGFAMWTRREAVTVVITALATSWNDAGAWAQASSAAATLCPTGKLRAALIASNPVLVTRRPDGTLGGVSVAIARALASHLDVPVELKPYDNPARYNESLATDDWDIGLAARDPARADHLAFSATFMEVDNGYVARPGAAPTNAEEVDRAGVKIAVAQGSAPHTVLRRLIKNAEIVPVP